MSTFRNDFVLAGAACGVMGLGGWIFYGLIFYSTTPAMDWLVFHGAARLFLEGHLSILYHADRFTAFLNEEYRDWLSQPLGLHPWLYPPHYLLLLLPFGLLPIAVAYPVFQLLTLAGAAIATWLYTVRSSERWLHAFSLLLCPAGAVTLCLGQNAFLTSALLVGGLGLAPRRPVLGGALLGLLTVKPQLFVLVPVALVASRQWKAMTSLAVAGLLLALLSLAVCGTGPWVDWIRLMLHLDDDYQRWRLLDPLPEQVSFAYAAFQGVKGQSVYAYAAFFGASPAFANAVQCAAAAGAACCVWWAYRTPMALDLRVAVVLAATMLASPHFIVYDAVILSVAAALFFVRLSRDGGRFGEFTIIMLVWMCQLFPPMLFRVGVVTPLVVAAFIACVLARGRRDRQRVSAVPAPPPWKDSAVIG